MLTDTREATNDDVMRVLSQSQTLKSLTLGYCEGISDGGIASLLGRGCCPRLHTLVLRGCRQLTLGFFDVPDGHPLELRSLDLSHVRGIEPETFQAIARRLPHLHTLVLWVRRLVEGSPHFDCKLCIRADEVYSFA